MKNLLTLALLFAFALQANAQSNQDKAKAYYFSAVEQYESRNYNKALDYCQQVEDLLGSNNARLEALRVKSYFDKNDIPKAKESLNTFLTLSPDENLLKEISPYIAKIDAAEEKQRKEKEEAERIAREKEEARIQEEERKANLIKNFANNKAKAIREAIAEGGFDENGLKKVKCYCAAPDKGKFLPNSLYGMIDKNGNEVIPIEYPFIYYLQNNGTKKFIVVENYENRTQGLFDVSGKIILPMDDYNNENYSTFFHESFGLGLLMVKKNGLFGYVNESGEVVIPFKFKSASRFEPSQPIRFRRKNGKPKNPKDIPNVAYVRDLNNKVYYINTKGEIVYDEYGNYYGNKK